MSQTVVKERKPTQEDLFWSRKVSPRERRLLDEFISSYQSPMQLYLTKYPHEFRYATQMVGVDEDDLEQACYVGLMRAARRFDAKRGNGFSTYAMFWMRACFWQVVRQKKMADRRLQFGGFDVVTSEIPARDEEEPRASVDPRVARCLDRLDPRVRMVIQCRYGLGVSKMTLREVGDEMRITKERVRQLQNKGLRKMRELLERSEYVHEE